MFASFNQTVARAVIGTVGTVFCAGLCLLGATAPAHAATFDDTVRRQTVGYADLDLSNAQGRAALDRRIVHAARAVCLSGGHDLARRAAETRCIRDAVDHARPQPVVTADAR